METTMNASVHVNRTVRRRQGNASAVVDSLILLNEADGVGVTNRVRSSREISGRFFAHCGAWLEYDELGGQLNLMSPIDTGLSCDGSAYVDVIRGCSMRTRRHRIRHVTPN
ncbi:unnamed protein product [Heligmosomoides polygyrus]|uniref:Transposase n=1 Tax=Heligmosomoides polygyrus TaxID=6339 RepID=A0A183G5W7_HELPZ|nr:unnamed protein product [Heligmosomoides polygyrus]